MSGRSARQSRHWANMADVRGTRAANRYRPSVQLIIRYLINSFANRAYRRLKELECLNGLTWSVTVFSVPYSLIVYLLEVRAYKCINSDFIFAKEPFVIIQHFRLISEWTPEAILVRDKHVYNLRLWIGTNGACNNQSCGPVYRRLYGEVSTTSASAGGHRRSLAIPPTNL